MADLRLNFTDVTALVVDQDEYSRTLSRQILRGFGAAMPHEAGSAAQAQAILAAHPVDLCLVEGDLPDMTGFDLVRWMRRCDAPGIRFMPILILTGYTQQRNVKASRDCGANGVVAKPFSPRTLFDHIAWAAASKRPYVECVAYVGPDRRFREEAAGVPRRRFTDPQDVAIQHGGGPETGAEAALEIRSAVQ